MRRLLPALLVAVLALGTLAAAAEAPIGLVVNGATIETDTPPLSIDDRTYVPIRVVSEALGAEVGWDGATRTVIVNLAAGPPADDGTPPPVDGDLPDGTVETLTAEIADLKGQVTELTETINDLKASVDVIATGYVVAAYNTEGVIEFTVDVKEANDLHIEFRHDATILDKGPFRNVSGNATSNVDLSNPRQNLNQGDKVELEIGTTASRIRIEKWWWTMNGLRIGSIHYVD